MEEVVYDQKDAPILTGETKTKQEGGGQDEKL